MSRVIVRELKKGSTSSVAMANLTLQSWRDAGSDIGGENVKEEGLWRRGVASRAITPANGRQNSYDYSGSFVDDTVLIRMLGSVVCGPISYNRDDGNKLIVRASLEFASAGRLQFALGYRIGAVGAFTEIEKTHREFEMEYDAPHIQYTRIKGSWTVSHLFTLGSSTLDTDELYFCVLFSSGGNVSDFSCINLFTTVKTR